MLLTGSTVSTNEKELLDRLWDLGHTPIKLHVLKKYIESYKSHEKDLLVSGFSEGFRLQFTGPRLPMDSKNLVSVENNKLATLEKLQKEVELGRMLGPFINKPISTLRISPIGLVEKSDKSWRLITHLSHPKDESVNDFIEDQFCTVKYSSFDKVLNMISSLGRSAELAKIDIRQAFRLLVVNPADFDLLGIKFEDKYYVDKCLPQGCRISCFLFETFSSFLHWVVEKESGISTLDHYLDDFIFAGAEATSDCQTLMDTFIRVADEMGVPLAENKTVGPVTKIVFLGLEIDTILMLVRIPMDKLDKLKLGVKYIIDHKKMKLKELESIVGLMAFCSRAIPSARAFTRRFYDVISAIRTKKSYYYVRINSEMKSDALVWLEFLQAFNGECYLTENIWKTNETINLFTDSAGSSDLGCAAYFNGQYGQFRWPGDWANKEFMSDLSFLEMVPVLMALYIWGDEFKNQRILFKIDNQSLVIILNKRTSRSKYVMQLLRPFVLLTMRNNIQFRAVHIFSSKNPIADALSRFQMVRFRELAPHASQTPADIPVEFWEVISSLK